jgi:glycosyltransferase involved in cell wall biosynthesis
VTVIPQFGVDTDTYRPTANEARKRPPQFRMGYVGRLVEEKGIDLLLRAAAELEGEWRLSILGDGPHKSPLKALAEGLGLVDHVTFQASIPSAEMPAHYKQLDALILPSRTRSNWKEQFGRVLIEAMACGVPVVGSSSGEIPHVIGEAGLIFPENDTDALTVHLGALMGNPGLRQALAQKGRERVLRHYTQKEVARATREVYLQVAAS